MASHGPPRMVVTGSTRHMGRHLVDAVTQDYLVVGDIEGARHHF